MKVWILVICLLTVMSCTNQSYVSTETQENSHNNLVSQNENIPVNQTEKIKDEKPLEKLQLPKGKIKLPNVKDYGVFQVFRHSGKKDESGRMIPPFEYADIGVSLDSKAKIGEKITIIPLKTAIEPFQLTISKVTKKENPGCEEPKKDFYFDIEFVKITNKKILEIPPIENNVSEFPFEVFGIYPAVNFAKNLSPPEVKQEMLPKGVVIQTVEAAIDLDNDGKPDILETSFCCENEAKSSVNDCEYICQKSFKKISGGWKLVSSANPC